MRNILVIKLLYFDRSDTNSKSKIGLKHYQDESMTINLLKLELVLRDCDGII